MPKKDEQSLWRWIRNAQIDFIISKFEDESRKLEPLRRDVDKDETKVVGEMLDLFDALKNAELTATETGVIIQRFWKGMTFSEIAKMMNVKHQTVEECYYKKAIVKLGLCLKGK